MHQGITLNQFFNEQWHQQPEIDVDLLALVDDMARACKRIAHAVSRGPLRNDLGNAGSENVQGEQQKKLDLIANDIMLRCHEWTGRVAALASEEMETIHPVADAAKRGKYLLVFDPLDGSTNIDVNLSIGTIFSVLPAPADRSQISEQDFLQPGRNQLCAGYAIYGPSTVLVLTLRQGVHSFVLDEDIGEFILFDADHRIPEQCCEFAINSARQRLWEGPVQRYIADCIAGSEGPQRKDYTMRWVGAMVADAHRVLSRGGIFLYPRNPYSADKPGKLRLLYEANPLALLVEQAGGRATTGTEPVLDVQPHKLHQRIPLILGSADEVARVEAYHRTDQGDG